MTNYREVLRLNSLGLNKVEIAQSEYVASDLTLASAKLDSCDGEVRHPRRMN